MTGTDYIKGSYSGDLESLAKEIDLPYLSDMSARVDPELFSLLPVEMASNLLVLPLKLANGTLHVAVADPLNLGLEQRLVAITGHPVSLSVAHPELIQNALKRAQSSRRMLDNVSRAFRTQLVQENTSGDEKVLDLETLQDQSGVVQLANSIMMGALQRNASDIHIEIYADRVDLKYRIDGVLFEATDPLDVSHHAELVSRIKVMADLDIAERRIPQDGRFRLRIDGRDIDFRVSILPTQFGEDVVIRILDKSALSDLGHAISLDDLGLPERDVSAIRKSVRAPYGLVLLTGPTGSGKTTTLYGAISELAQGEEKIITIEDPIEYQLNGIVQIAVNAKKGMTFASGLRAILRHDPDRIMVGEIRDFETATIAVQAALTGHLVLASVHANSSFDVISRFAHWGIDLHDFVAALNGVFAQRLLRNLCPECKSAMAPDNMTPEVAAVAAALSGASLQEATGCDQCFHTGYQGRQAIIEHLKIKPDLAEMMVARAPAARLQETAVASGMQLLRDAALQAAAAGDTSLAEVMRVTSAE